MDKKMYMLTESQLDEVFIKLVRDTLETTIADLAHHLPQNSISARRHIRNTIIFMESKDATHH